MCWSVARSFDSHPGAPAEARGFLADQIRELSGGATDLTDWTATASLVVSELVTNAVRGGSPTAVVELAVHHDHADLSVTDQAAGVPQRRHPNIGDAGGRGLGIIAAVSRRWGVDPVPGGKRVWVELDLPSTVGEAVECAFAGRPESGRRR